jgi:hypothetical protein
MAAKPCIGTINLFSHIDRCELELDHHGPCENSSYGPTLHWTANRYWATEPTGATR